MELVNIFVVSHKKMDELKSINLLNGYKYIHVGNSDSNGYEFTDSTGNNIGYKNKNYCELTATYWLNKNISSQIKGIVHYRRFFFHPSLNLFNASILKEKEIIKTLSSYDVILPVKRNLKVLDKCKTCRDHFIKCHGEKNLNYLTHVIKSYFPEYTQKWIRQLESYKISCYNMIIAKEDVFNKYCNFVFDILNKTEEYITTHLGIIPNDRIFGFMAERLTDLFFDDTEYKIKRFSVINTDGNIFKQNIKCLLKFD